MSKLDETMLDETKTRDHAAEKADAEQFVQAVE